eukprot:c11405_g1_i2.p1 GENE.c11405_g1_i2~~c11405_g1_i2.p1  ORF type:complete len:319 (-),score=105.43 c11405_g1_i2:254-1210(-)
MQSSRSSLSQSKMSHLEMVIKSLSDLVIINNTCVAPQKVNDENTIFVTQWKFEWISIEEYIQRIHKATSWNDEIFVAALCFLRKLETEQVFPAFTQQTCHRIYFTCLVLALQSYGEQVNTTYLSKISGIESNDLVDMQHCALTGIDFTYTVPIAEVYQCIQDLSRVIHLPVNLEQKRPKSMKMKNHAMGPTISSFATLNSRFEKASPKVILGKNCNLLLQPTSTTSSNKSLSFEEDKEEKELAGGRKSRYNSFPSIFRRYPSAKSTNTNISSKESNSLTPPPQPFTGENFQSGSSFGLVEISSPSPSRGGAYPVMIFT